MPMLNKNGLLVQSERYLDTGSRDNMRQFEANCLMTDKSLLFHFFFWLLCLLFSWVGCGLMATYNVITGFNYLT